MKDQIALSAIITVISSWLVFAVINWLFDGRTEPIWKYLRIDDTPWFLIAFLGFISYLIIGLGVFSALTYLVYSLIFG
jgi:hypothetical protein